MRPIHTSSDPDRWTWFAAGEPGVAPPARSRPGNNTPQQVIWEIGLVIAVPLALAALFAVLRGA